MLLKISDIRIGRRLRAPRPAVIAELAENIGRIGLQMPISVSSGVSKLESGGSGVSFDLVAGLHRLEACRSLGHEEIEATIVQMDADERVLWEIDENLCRADLTELERGEHLVKRKEIYERKWPQTRVGAAQASGMNRALGNVAEISSATSFSVDTAEKVGVTDRTIRQSIRRASKIDSKVRDRIRDNPEIADSGAELDALAAMTTPEEQRKAVALVETGQAAGIRDAVRLMKPKPPKIGSHFKEAEQARQKRRETFTKAWNALDEEDREWARGEIDGPAVADNTTALRAVK
jgi:ParB family transcriptional regulator, chromosome partitioning protein